MKFSLKDLGAQPGSFVSGNLKLRNPITYIFSTNMDPSGKSSNAELKRQWNTGRLRFDPYSHTFSVNPGLVQDPTTPEFYDIVDEAEAKTLTLKAGGIQATGADLQQILSAPILIGQV